MNAALQQLAGKSPAFNSEVQAYDAATSEMLRWRARTASSIARARSGEFQTLDKYLYDATVSQDPFLGLFPERPDGQFVSIEGRGRLAVKWVVEATGSCEVQPRLDK